MRGLREGQASSPQSSLLPSLESDGSILGHASPGKWDGDQTALQKAREDISRKDKPHQQSEEGISAWLCLDGEGTSCKLTKGYPQIQIAQLCTMLLCFLYIFLLQSMSVAA